MLQRTGLVRATSPADAHNYRVQSALVAVAHNAARQSGTHQQQIDQAVLLLLLLLLLPSPHTQARPQALVQRRLLAHHVSRVQPTPCGQLLCERHAHCGCVSCRRLT
jgi:hypothetical protein